MIALKKDINFQKHILISGKSESERHLFLNEMLNHSDIEAIFFPKSMKQFSEYIDTVQSKNLFQPHYVTKGKYNSNQILDFHLDWIAENNCLFVWEEFQYMKTPWKLEILRLMINNLEANHQSATKIIITTDDSIELITDLNHIVNKTDYKTKEQVVESNFQIIDL
ncbi:hypothetical protein [Chryseobacterium sp.]|uniref:hypothetical protein n=1 Tax=Chryseobacterium sp. TaxID=1871047 RepID=UPI003340CEF8